MRELRIGRRGQTRFKYLANARPQWQTWWCRPRMSNQPSPAIWVSVTQQPLGWTEGFWWRPSWSAPREEQRPPEINAKEPGEWPHGWQCWTSSVSDSHQRTAARRANLRSHSGWNAGAALAFALTALEFSIQSHLFRVFHSWNGCSCHCQLLKQCVKVAMRRWMHMDDTEQDVLAAHV